MDGSSEESPVSQAAGSSRRPGLLSIVACLLMLGCSHLPRSGPTGTAVSGWNAGEESVETATR